MQPHSTPTAHTVPCSRVPYQNHILHLDQPDHSGCTKIFAICTPFQYAASHAAGGAHKRGSRGRPPQGKTRHPRGKPERSREQPGENPPPTGKTRKQQVAAQGKPAPQGPDVFRGFPGPLLRRLLPTATAKGGRSASARRRNGIGAGRSATVDAAHNARAGSAPGRTRSAGRGSSKAGRPDVGCGRGHARAV